MCAYECLYVCVHEYITHTRTHIIRTFSHTRIRTLKTPTLALTQNYTGILKRLLAHSYKLIYMHAHKYTHNHASAHTYPRAHTYARSHIHVHTHTSAHKHVHTLKHIHTNTHANTHARTHKHTQTHTLRPTCKHVRLIVLCIGPIYTGTHGCLLRKHAGACRKACG